MRFLLPSLLVAAAPAFAQYSAPAAASRAMSVSGAAAASFAAAAPAARLTTTASLSIAPAAALTAAAPSAAGAPAMAAPSAVAAAAASPADAAPAAARTSIAMKEFDRLVSELTGGDAAKAKAAADGLRALKDTHLNADLDLKQTNVLKLKPMQIPAGMYEVQDKAQMLQDMKGKDADKWLKEKSVPVIEDYKGRKRPVDHHHEARAAWEAGIDDVYTHRYFDDAMHDKIKGLEKDQFYAVAKAMGLFYDRDQFGAGPHDPNHLPEDIRSMADDPFRSVAWQVRKRGGYDKTATPFAEFYWANYFRANLKTYPTREDFEKAVVEAMKLVRAAGAKDLPGFKAK